MRYSVLLIASVLFTTGLFSQGRNVNKLTLETTYSHTEIHKSLRDLVDNVKKENYFDDEFFNSMLKKILLDKQFTSKEKVQLFYLMQKKLGYAFVGVNYLPPKQNYYIFHLSKVHVLEQTKKDLATLNMDPHVFIQIADSHRTNDPIISSNALLLATLINSSKTLHKLQQSSESSNILKSKNPAIYNHYLCLSGSLSQDSVVQKNLKNNLMLFKEEEMIEDALCALYSQPQAIAPVKNYISEEKNPENDLSIMTALCILNSKLSAGTFSQGIKKIAESTKDQWKKELLEKAAEGKLPYTYSLTSETELVTKIWKNVNVTLYNDGALISNKTLLEFDPN